MIDRDELERLREKCCVSDPAYLPLFEAIDELKETIADLEKALAVCEGINHNESEE